MLQKCEITTSTSGCRITGSSLAGECLNKTTLGLAKIYREVELDAQLVSRGGFLKERLRKTKLGLKIANVR